MVRCLAKYDWKNLKKEYLLSEYITVSSFLKAKNIPNNGQNRKMTKGWANDKRQKEDKVITKTVEKIIEKQAEKDANEAITINKVADALLKKVNEAVNELNTHVDMFGNQHNSIVDRNDLKKLTSALKDIDDVLKDKNKANDIEDLTVLADLLGFGDSKRKQ